MKKRGLQLTISTLIVIVLGVLVLITLTVTFTTGWGKFLGRLGGYESSEIDVMISQCRNYCNIGARYSFCCDEREIDFGGGEEKVRCQELVPDKLECRIDCKDVC